MHMHSDARCTPSKHTPTAPRSQPHQATLQALKQMHEHTKRMCTQTHTLALTAQWASTRTTTKQTCVRTNTCTHTHTSTRHASNAPSSTPKQYAHTHTRTCHLKHLPTQHTVHIFVHAHTRRHASIRTFMQSHTQQITTPTTFTTNDRPTKNAQVAHAQPDKRTPHIHTRTRTRSTHTRARKDSHSRTYTHADMHRRMQTEIRTHIHIDAHACTTRARLSLHTRTRPHRTTTFKHTIINELREKLI